MNAPNPGASFANAFEQTRNNRLREEQMRAEAAERAEDRQLRRDEIQSRQALAQLDQHRDAIKIGAAIIRQVQPQDQAGWDQALGMLSQYGINPDAIGVPRQFMPDYVGNIVKLADALGDQAQDPSFIREADALGIPRDEAARLWRQRQGMVVINGVPHMMAQPSPLGDGWELDEGGPSQDGSGNFSGPR